MRADFDRVYSPPEPPEPSRWRPRGWQVGLLCFLLAAGAAFFVVPLVLAESPEEGAMPTLTAEKEDVAEPSPEPADPAPAEEPDGPDGTPSSSEPPASVPAGGGVLTDLPKTVCETVSTKTIRKWVSANDPDEYGGPRAGSCGYTSGEGDDFRYLRLETRLADGNGDADPISTAQWAFGKDYELQKEDKLAKTLLLEKVPGVGEEAFRRVSTDVGAANAVTARMAVRVQNVIVTVSYSRGYAEKPGEEQDECLRGALEVAEEALRTYT